MFRVVVLGSDRVGVREQGHWASQRFTGAPYVVAGDHRALEAAEPYFTRTEIQALSSSRYLQSESSSVSSLHLGGRIYPASRKHGTAAPRAAPPLP